MRKARGKCITCREDVGLGSYFCVMYKGRARIEHSDCRLRAEGAAVAFGLLGMAEAIAYRQRPTEVRPLRRCAKTGLLRPVHVVGA